MFERIRNLQIWIRLMLAIGLLMFAAGVGLITWNAKAQRDLAIQQSKEFASSINQMTMATLVFMKTTKTLKKRHIFLDQVKQSKDVTDLRVVRAEVTNKQFGDGDEDEMRIGPDEKESMTSGKPYFDVRDDPQHGKVLKAVFPHFNEQNYLGKNCQECHDEAPPKALLGAVTMEISLKNAQESVDSSRNKLIAATLITLGALLALIYVLVHRFVSRPLNDLAARLRDIAQGEGDLTQRIPAHADDEIGRTATYFNQMMEKLQDVMRRVAQSSEHVSSSATQLQASTQEIRHAINDESEKSAAAAAAVEQMAASIMSVAQSSNDVLALARGSLERANQGNAEMANLTRRLTEVQEAVAKITSTVEDFIKHTGSISMLTREVKEIAEQTNLLALNAAIEAARAGEHGRGFAVVADEVRKLAEKSTRSAGEIDQVTKNLNSDSENVRESISVGLAVLETIRNAMANVADTLSSTMESTSGVADGMNSITAATDQQLQASTLAASSVESIAALAHETSASVEEVAKAAEDLEPLAANLQNEIHRFRI